MSQDQSALPPLSVIQQIRVGDYAGQAATALFVFEYTITLDQEIDTIWKQHYSLGTVLFAVTRYTSLAQNSQLIWGFLPVITSIQVRLTIHCITHRHFMDHCRGEWSFPSLKECRIRHHTDSCRFCSCNRTLIIIEVLNAIQFLCFATFTAFRAYCLLQGIYTKWFLSGIICVLSLMPFALNVLIYPTRLAVYVADLYTCTSKYEISAHLHLCSVSLPARISACLADVLVLFITWYRTADVHKTARMEGLRSPITTLLLRDGTLYFNVLLLINITAMVFGNIPSLVYVQMAVPMQQAITPILVCRFMMNLRKITFNLPSGTSEHDGRPWSSIRFVGNMGEMLLAPGEELRTEGRDDELPQGQEEHSEGSKSDVSLPSVVDRRIFALEVGGGEDSVNITPPSPLGSFLKLDFSV
ncbi:hypothetical protein BDW22DRAFT_846671 [Trametopsis cervina]|nr:hypothetical protein BDW22DRAFT_846671 [Trametopsis cervina]